MKKMKQLGAGMFAAIVFAGIVMAPQSNVKAAAKSSQTKAVQSVQKYLDKNVEDITCGGYGYGYFADMDMDGKLELVAEIQGGTMGNEPKIVYKIKSNGKLQEIGYTDANYVNLFYNKKTKKYVYLTKGEYHSGPTDWYGETCELVKRSGKLKEKNVFSYSYKYKNGTKKNKVYYVNNKKVSKSTYNKSKNSYMGKLTKVKVKTKKFNLATWNTYSKNKKNSLLTQSYKAFTYKK